MRYDDASQAGSMANDHSPVARPDVDALPPGSFGPASGNTITGAGTTTGASGEDSVGNPPAHIVAVQGAGGPATNANGNFQATGQYGVLNMDAQGNFNYVRNGGTPDGVQDVFNYTLANADGQSSTTLTIDIAKGGTGQAQVIPGTVIPGVVNLPAGVQMSDIHVNGRDLVINMPDGTQMVIPNGAVFVPQLVIGDVQLPPSNLAALLVESEPQPAAGQLPSSGGNFATDVPPLDPGVPLGDLIPPTELNFPPPTIEIIGQIINHHPEAGSVSVQLDDDALPGGNPGGVGDDPDSVNAVGTLPGSGGDAPIHWDLLTTGAPAGFTYVDGPNGSILVQQVQNGSTVTVLTITIDATDGDYTVTQNAPILHPAGGDENNVVFVINYNVVDVDGDTAAGTLTINVDDDTPVVSNVQTGPGVSLDETTAGSPAGFPISATSVSAAISATLSFGADGANGAPVYALSLNGGVSTLASGLSTSIGDHPITLNLTSSTLITATYTDGSGTHTAFTVALNSNGTITVTQYVPLEHGVASNPDTDETLSLAGLVNATVTITDKDGDSATGTAPIGGSILFHDDGPSISLADHGVANLVVDETDLSVNASASFAANFNASFGGDGPGGVSYALGISAAGADSGLIDSATGQHIFLVLNNGVVEGHVGATDGALAFTVSVDSNGVVTLDQIRAVIHPDGTNPDTSEPVTLAADNLVSLTATATDSDGDTATQALNIGTHLIFQDDGPSISAGGTEPSLTVDETDLATNATGNFSGIFTNISFGADGPAASGATAYTLGISSVGADSGLIDSQSGNHVFLFLEGGVVVGREGANAGAAAAGPIVFTVSVDADGNVTLDQSRAVIHPDGTNPDTSEGVTLGSDNLITLTGTVTDKDGDSASASANIGQNLHFNDDGPSISASATQPSLTVDETNLAINASASFASVFSPSFGNDGPAASNSLTYALGISASGADSGLIDSATGQHIVLVLNGGVVEGHVGTTGGALAFTVSVDSSGVVTLDQIRAVIHPTGSNPDTSEGVTLSADNLVTLTATATDKDGDQATATANIGQNLNFLDDGPTINASSTQPTLTVDETNLAANASSSFASVFTGSFGNDGPAASNATVYTLGISASGANSGLVDSLTGQNIVLVLNGNTVEGHVGTTGGALAFTVTVDSSGVVTLDQIRAVIHGSPDVGDSNEPVTLSADNLVTLTATITDKDGDSASATANIGQNLVFLDDGPLAVNDTVSQPSENQAFSFNVFGNDSFGADGVDIHSLSHVSFTQPAQGTITYDTTTGLFTFTPAPGQQGSTTFTYTITDADGDHSTATVTINLANDSVPIPTAQVAFSDDDGLATGNPASTTGDIDANQGETPTTNPSEVIYNGQLVVNFGSDTPGSITFANLNGTTGTVGTETVSYSWNAGTNTLTATTVGGSRPGTVLFDIHVTNTATGTYVLTQHTNILEAAGGNETSAPPVVLHYQAVDSDGSTSTAGTLTITFNDDAPTVTAGGSVPSLTVDETNLAVNASASFSSVFSHNFGADGAASSNSVTYQLGISASGANSGLVDSLTGQNIVLVLNAGVVEGHVGTTGGALAFTVSVDSSGVVTLDQIRAVIHPTGSNPDTSEGVTLSAANLVTLTQTVTDGDGDQASATANIGTNLNFLDDGPTAHIVTTGQTVSLDESAGNQADSKDVTGPLAVFSGVANVGDDPDVAGTGAIQYATNVSALVASTGTLFGNDGPASSNSISFSLNVSASGVDSGLQTTDGTHIFLFKEGNIIVGRPGANAGAAASNPAAFAIAIDPSTGAVSMVEYLSIHQPDATNPDDSVSITNGAVLAVVTATDADGDQSTASTAIGSLLSFQDSAPIMVAADNINIQNDATPTFTGAFHYDLGADGPPTDNNVFKAMTGSATVNGTAVQNYTISETSENATTAVYSFSFDYPNGSGTTAHETGTLTFDKVAGTYTVSLSSPISGFSILATAGAPASAFINYDLNSSTTSNSPSEVATVKLADSFYLQFSGTYDKTGSDHQSTTSGDTTYLNGSSTTSSGGAFSGLDLFTQANATVTISSTAAGVAGNTIQGGEVLDFNLYTTDEQGFLGNTPNQSATSMFIELDGVGGSEDMIIILKLYDTVTHQYSTEALMVQNGDIIVQSTAGQLAGTPYAGITLDSNDGLIVIEPNDYQQGNTNLVIVGAQIAGSDDGVVGTAVNFNGTVGSSGGSSGTQAFSTDVSDAPFKIQNIGFLTQSSTDQTAHLTFTPTIQDGDGDSITQTITADVTNNANSTTAITLDASVTTVTPVVLDLNGDGVHFLGTDAGVHYDYGSGSVATAWASPQDGILAFDANHDGTVSNASEFVFGGNGVTDLQALSAYDTNHDGQLTSADAQFSSFVVWQDANSNGVADAGEVKSLMALGITSISLSSNGISYTAANGDVTVSGTGSYTLANGSTGQLADAAFATGPRTAANDDLRSSSALASNAALIAAVAAAGLGASEPLAAHGISENSSAATGLDTAAQHTQAFAPVALDAVSGTHGLDLAASVSDGHSEAAAVNSSSHVSENAAGVSFDAAASHSDGQAPAALSQGTDAPAGGAGASPAGFTAEGVGMPSAALLMAAAAAHGGVAGQSAAPQHDEVVGKVLADALHGGGSGPNVEALVNSLPQGGDHGHAAADALASHAAAAVPNGDMGIFAGFTGGLGMHMMQQMTVHADAAPAHG